MALAEESVQAPAAALELAEVLVVAAAVAVGAGVAAATEPHWNSSDRLSARPGLTARKSGSSRKEKEVWLPCYSSSGFGLVITQPWRSLAGRIRAGCSVIAPEKSGAKIMAR